MYLVLKTAPAALIAASDIKTHLRVSHTAEDTLIGTLATAAIQTLDGPDGMLRRALVTQVWYAKLEDFPTCDEIRLPIPPLISVVAVTYYDTDNALQTFTADDYQVVTPYGAAGYIALKYGKSWPPTYDRPDAVTIEFSAGYGGASSVPYPIRQAALLLAGDMYANRGDDAGESGSALIARNATRNAIESLISRYIWREAI